MLATGYLETFLGNPLAIEMVAVARRDEASRCREVKAAMPKLFSTWVGWMGGRGFHEILHNPAFLHQATGNEKPSLMTDFGRDQHNREYFVLGSTPTFKTNIPERRAKPCWNEQSEKSPASKNC